MQIYTDQTIVEQKQTIRGSIANNTSWTQQSPTIVIVLQNHVTKVASTAVYYTKSTTQVAVMFICKENIHTRISYAHQLTKKCYRNIH